MAGQRAQNILNEDSKCVWSDLVSMGKPTAVLFWLGLRAGEAAELWPWFQVSLLELLIRVADEKVR